MGNTKSVILAPAGPPSKVFHFPASREQIVCEMLCGKWAWNTDAEHKRRDGATDGVGGGAAITPDVCAVAAVLPGRAPWAGTAHSDVAEERTVMSAGNAL